MEEESDKRLYGDFQSAAMPEHNVNASSPAAQTATNQLAHQVNNLYVRGSVDDLLARQRSHSGSGDSGIGGARPRSDSVDSRGSVTSAGSASGRLHAGENQPPTAGSPGGLFSSSVHIPMSNNVQMAKQTGVYPTNVAAVSDRSHQTTTTTADNPFKKPDRPPPPKLANHPGAIISQSSQQVMSPQRQGGGAHSPGDHRYNGHQYQQPPSRPGHFGQQFPRSNGASSSSTPSPHRNQPGVAHTPTKQVTFSPVLSSGPMLHPQTEQMHGPGMTQESVSVSRPGHFGHQLPRSNSGSQYSSPSTPSPLRDQSGVPLPYSHPGQGYPPSSTFSPVLTGVNSSSPGAASGMYPVMVGSPPLGNHTSQMFLHVAPGHTVPVSGTQQTFAPGSTMIAAAHAGYVQIPSGIPPELVAAAGYGGPLSPPVGYPSAAVVGHPAFDPLANPEDGAYTQGKCFVLCFSRSLQLVH